MQLSKSRRAVPTVFTVTASDFFLEFGFMHGGSYEITRPSQSETIRQRFMKCHFRNMT